MYLIEISDYSLPATGSGSGLQNVYFTLSGGDVCFVQSDSIDDTNIFLKALATLAWPENGTYRYKGEAVDFCDYRNLLPIKKKISYIGPDASMISNKTIYENLLLLRSYFENSLSLTLDENTIKLCRTFQLENKLNLRPGELRPVELRTAVAVRELTKSFDILLIERPEDYIGHSNLDLFNEILKDNLMQGHAVVFTSNNRDFIETFANRKVLIADGTLTIVTN